MTRSVLIFLCLSFFLAPMPVTYGEDLKEFIEDVNSAWTNRNYAGIMSNINARLTVDTNDVLALGLKMNYYLWADLNTSNAHAAARSFSNAVHQSQRQDLFPLANNFVSVVMNVDETNSYTSAQRDKLHSMFPDMFPSIVEQVSFYAMFCRTNAPPEE